MTDNKMKLDADEQHLCTGHDTHDLLGVLGDILAKQDIMTVAQRVTGDKSISVLKYHLGSFSQQVLGMLGSHNNLAITVRRKNSNDPEEIDLFVKSVPYDEPSKAEFIANRGIFVKESLLFEKAIPFLTENYKGDKWAATCYLAKKDLLVLENLRSQGYRLFDALYNDLSAIKSVIEALARFHSCSILAEARLKQMGEDRDTLDKYWTDLFKETMFTQPRESNVWVQASIKAASAVAESYGHDPQKIRNACEKIHEIIQPSEGHRNVICHGDLWTNNVMIDDRSEPFKCVLVDFQLIRYAPLVLDILQLLHINTSREFREKFERTLVEHYHSVLHTTIRNNGSVDNSKILSVDAILTGLDDFRLFGAIIACFYRLLGPKVAIECSKSPETSARFSAGDVLDVIHLCMEEDGLYKIQVEDAISELAENSQRL